MPLFPHSQVYFFSSLLCFHNLFPHFFSALVNSLFFHSKSLLCFHNFPYHHFVFVLRNLFPVSSFSSLLCFHNLISSYHLCYATFSSSRFISIHNLGVLADSRHSGLPHKVVLYTPSPMGLPAVAPAGREEERRLISKWLGADSVGNVTESEVIW